MMVFDECECHKADFGTVRGFQERDFTSDFVISAQFNRCCLAGFKLLMPLRKVTKRLGTSPTP